MDEGNPDNKLAKLHIYAENEKYMRAKSLFLIPLGFTSLRSGYLRNTFLNNYRKGG